MKIFFSITFVAIGLITVLLLGLPKVYSYEPYRGITFEGYVAMFLVFGGGITALGGSAFAGAGNSYSKGPLRKSLFTACFIAYVIVGLVGLANVFNTERVGTSIYLLIIAFLGAFISAAAAVET